MKSLYCIYLAVTCTVFFTLYSCVKEDSAFFEKQNSETDAPVFAVAGQVRIKTDERLALQLESMADEKGIVHSTGVKSSDEILCGIGFKSMRRTFPPAGKFEARTRAEGLHRWYDITFDPDTRLTKAETDLSSIEGIETVELRPEMIAPEQNFIPINIATKSYGDARIFNDPYLARQWNYYNDGSYSGEAGCDINVLPVWENGFTGDPDVIVAVVDGGIDYEHEDLKDNIWINEAEMNGLPGVDDDGNGYIDDIYGYDFVLDKELIKDDHGTHVAGTIAAVNNNGTGVCGIAGGDYAKGIKGVKVMSCQTFINKIGGDGARAIKYGADNGAVISQNSWSYGPTTVIPESDIEAIDYFIKYAGVDEHGNQTGPMKGGIVIFAAGNDGAPLGSPASYEPVVAVSALAADYERAYYSNYGTWCDIAAPGGDEYVDHMVLSTITGNRYGENQGTSMACPHVSGAAALIISIYGGTGFTNDDLKKILLENTNRAIYENGHNINYHNRLGSGMLDVARSFASLSKEAPQAVSDFKIKNTGMTEIGLTWKVPEDKDDGQPAFFNLYLSTSKFDSKTLDRDNIPENISVIRIDNELAAGETMAYTLSGLKDNTIYYIGIDANDLAMNRSDISNILECSTDLNYPPYEVKQLPDITLLGAGYSTSIKLTDYFSDPNNEKLEFSYSIDGSTQIAEITLTDDLLTMTASGPGHAIIKTEAKDGLGKSISSDFRLNVTETGPEYFCYPNPITNILNVKTSSIESKTIHISIESMSGTKVSGPVQYMISSSTIVSINVENIKPGNYTVIITDYNGKTTTQNVTKL